ncbi:putative nuclease HARBI1 [Zophobas morio]|uniref:putative nuclease HARBI1 n=1 Tax=Zophobas morio TaxID=2755281 RepID=UPI00308366CF
MLLVTLRFLATGSFLQVAGDFIGISKATASQIIHKVSRAIATLIVFIKMPATEDDFQRNSHLFHKIARFPKYGEEPKIYRNRKGFFSINVQVNCDATLKIQNIVYRWTGSSHDSTIFNNSRVRAKFEAADYRQYLILGDSGYAIRPFLLTPLRVPAT